VNGRLSDDEIERIAGRVVAKLIATFVMIAVVAILGIWLLPTALLGLLVGTAAATRDLPQPIAVTITAAVLAAPVVALIVLWSRRGSAPAG